MLGATLSPEVRAFLIFVDIRARQIENRPPFLLRVTYKGH